MTFTALLLIGFVFYLASNCFHAWIDRDRPKPTTCDRCKRELEYMRISLDEAESDG